ncbi:MAG: sensor domain-containing diguanylate cyclase [Pseudohongiellaceae bacterium]|nr:sensor domain-containing diguanylate cyclase [Pseudohongiellaceae bacterium]
MKQPDIPDDETLRLETLREYSILDTASEERFDRVTRMAKRLFNVPIAIVSLVDENRQWFKSCVGLDVSETPREVSFCAHAILGPQVFVVPDTLLDERFDDNPLVLDSPNIRFYAGCPLRAINGQRLGTLCIIDEKPREFSQEDCAALQDLAIIVEREMAAVQLASLDDLTDIANRRGFLFLAQQQIERGIRNDEQMCLAYFDLDNFKKINDTYGHAQGDKVLRVFASAMLSSFRQSDLCARIGGDEFVAIFSTATLEVAQGLIDRLRETLEHAVEKDSSLASIDFTYGLTPYIPERHVEVEKWLSDADKSLYRDKHNKNT